MGCSEVLNCETKPILAVRSPWIPSRSKPHLGNVKSQNRDLWLLVNPIPPIFNQPHCMVPWCGFIPYIHHGFGWLLRCLYPWWKPLQPSALHSLHLAVGTNLWAQPSPTLWRTKSSNIVVGPLGEWMNPQMFFFTGKNLWCSFLVDIWYIYVYNSMYIHIIYTYISFMIVMNMSNEISLGRRSISQFVHTTTHFSVWMLSPYHIISPNFLHKQS
jgi:hypothetical protein